MGRRTFFERIAVGAAALANLSLAQAASSAEGKSDMSAPASGNEADGRALQHFLQVGPGAVTRTFLEKQRETVSVKDFGALGDGKVDDTKAIQAAIDASYGNTLIFPPGKYVCGQLYIRRSIRILGSLRQLSGPSYLASRTTIYFPNIRENEWALTISGDGAGIVGLELSGISFSGNSTGGGIYIAGTRERSISDAAYRDVLIYNFSIGVAQTYSICALFENVRIQSCSNGLQNRSQTNNVAFLRCSIATISKVAISHSNTEGAEYISCNFANWSQKTYPLTLYQSTVLMTSPYFENISCQDLALVGNTSEAQNAASSLTIISPFKLNNDIAVSTSAFVEVVGGIRGRCRIYGVNKSLVAVRSSRATSDNNLKWTVQKFSEKCAANQLPQFQPYGAAQLSYSPLRGYTRITNSSRNSGSGVNLTNTPLRIGDVYTLKLALRASSEQSTAKLRHGQVVAEVPLVGSTEAAGVRIYPFIATSESLQLEFSGDIDFFGFSVEAGNDVTPSDEIFCVPASAITAYVGEAVAPPSAGTWMRGDRLYSRSPTANEPLGWVCTEQGSPGAWRAWG